MTKHIKTRKQIKPFKATRKGGRSNSNSPNEINEAYHHYRENESEQRERNARRAQGWEWNQGTQGWVRMSPASPHDILRDVANNDIQSVQNALADEENIDQMLFPSMQTPLMIAIRNNNVDMVRLLIDNGADTTIRNRNNQSALDIARIEGNVEIINILNNSFTPINIISPREVLRNYRTQQNTRQQNRRQQRRTNGGSNRGDKKQVINKEVFKEILKTDPFMIRLRNESDAYKSNVQKKITEKRNSASKGGRKNKTKRNR